MFASTTNGIYRCIYLFKSAGAIRNGKSHRQRSVTTQYDMQLNVWLDTTVSRFLYQHTLADDHWNSSVVSLLDIAPVHLKQAKRVKTIRNLGERSTAVYWTIAIIVKFEIVWSSLDICSCQTVENNKNRRWWDLSRGLKHHVWRQSFWKKVHRRSLVFAVSYCPCISMNVNRTRLQKKIVANFRNRRFTEHRQPTLQLVKRKSGMDKSIKHCDENAIRSLIYDNYSNPMEPNSNIYPSDRRSTEGFQLIMKYIE